MQIFIETVKWCAMLLLGGGALYFHYNDRLKAKTSALILQAEQQYQDVTKAGGQKFSWVVESLYAMIPLLLRPLVTRAFLEELVQSVFDNIQEYAKLQLDRLLGQTTKEQSEN